MPAKQQNSNHGGNKKHGRDQEKCASWRKSKKNHFGDRKHFTTSKENRQCGPIGYKLRLDNARKITARQRREEREQERRDNDTFDGTNIAVIAGNVGVERIISKRAPVSIRI